MKILLVNPNSTSAYLTFGFVFPPLGLLYIAAAAEQAGHEVVVEDFCLTRKRIKDFDFSGFDVVGITVDAKRHPGAVKVGLAAKKAGAAVVMGGPLPIFIDDEMLRSGSADFIVRGEGEITFPALLETIEKGGDPAGVEGISYFKDGKTVRNEAREVIADLDTLPMPARHLIDLEAYKQAGFKYGGIRPITVISTSRGCPYDCSFCLTPQISGRQWRERSAESIIKELEELYHTYGYRAIAVCDDNFTVSPKRAIEVANMIIERKMDIWWWCLSSPDILLKNEQMIEKMAESGLKTVYMGVESASPETLKEFKKNLKQDTAQRAVDLLRKNNVQIFASYILGSMNDTVGSIFKTIKMAKKLDAGVAQFTIMTPYPGTALFKVLEGKLRHRKWASYDGLHLVFQHGTIPGPLMHMLLGWAYLSYYARGSKAIKGFILNFIRNAPLLRKISRSRREKPLDTI